MAVRTPIVRHFIACEEAIRLPDVGQYILRNVLYAIQRPEGAPNRYLHPQIDFFALLTDGLGEHSFALQGIWWEGSEERSIFTTPQVTIDFGKDPLRVFLHRFRLRNIPFGPAGLYEFRLLHGGDLQEIIAREAILLRARL